MSTPVSSVWHVGLDVAPPISLQRGAPETGDFHGYEVDLLRAVAHKVGARLAYRKALWSVLVEELASGALDLVCSAATVTTERSQQVAFCHPHLPVALALVTRKNQRGDLEASTSRVGVRQGNHSTSLLARPDQRKSACDGIGIQ